MKSILIAATIVGVAIVVAYYLLADDEGQVTDVPAMSAD